MQHASIDYQPFVPGKMRGSYVGTMLSFFLAGLYTVFI